MLLHEYVWGDSFLEYNMDHDRSGPLKIKALAWPTSRPAGGSENQSYAVTSCLHRKWFFKQSRDSPSDLQTPGEVRSRDSACSDCSDSPDKSQWATKTAERMGLSMTISSQLDLSSCSTLRSALFCSWVSEGSDYVDFEWTSREGHLEAWHSDKRLDPWCFACRFLKTLWKTLFWP